ncbi:MAG: glycyl-radical enzyme activating protein [Dehalococcoidia bacterium]
MSSKDSDSNSKGLVFNIQKYSLDDGPGIRTTVFMKGCSLACKWCSNPESINQNQETMTRNLRCIACGKCAAACPIGAIAFTDGHREINWEKCNNCLECAKVCPAKAIEYIGHYMTVEEVMKKVEADRTFYENSNGGMTISGGEPLVQPKFVRDLFKSCREKGIHTTLDTSSNVPWQHIENVLEYVDLVLQDIKHMDTGMHKKGTGVGNELILENAKNIAMRKRIWIRIPLIPGFNDSEVNIKKTAEFGLDIGVEKISLLPYHELGASKYQALGRVYPMQGTKPPGKKVIEKIRKTLGSYGLEVEIGR